MARMNLPPGIVRALDRWVVSRGFGMRYRPGRIFMEALGRLDRVPKGVRLVRGMAGGRPALAAVPAGAGEKPKLVFLHGGSFCFQSPRVYGAFSGHLALALGGTVLMPSYRLAPEHQYPAALDDALAAWRALREEFGPLILGGDSAGGNLALSATIALRDAGEPRPLGLFLMSPWADLTLSGESVERNDGKDAILRRRQLPPHVRAFAGDIDPADPRVSPLNAELAGLPPTLIQCGADELFLSEDTELASRLEAAGGQTDLQIFDGMWHDFQVHAGHLEESARAVRQVAEWAEPLAV